MRMEAIRRTPITTTVGDQALGRKGRRKRTPIGKREVRRITVATPTRLRATRALLVSFSEIQVLQAKIKGILAEEK